MSAIFFISLAGGMLVQLLTRHLPLNTVLGFVSYAAYSIHQEFFMPYTGGGASFWPLDLIFGGASATMGALGGAWLVSRKQSR